MEVLTHDEEGRLRLGWRILLFLGLFLGIRVVAVLGLPIGGITGAALATLAGALGAGWVLLALDGRGPGALGFHLAASVPREVAAGALLGVVLAVVVVGGMTVLGGVHWSGESGSASAWLTGAVSLAVFLALPAAAEEALLRGYPLQALAERWGAGWALAVTSAAFGAMHVWNPGATALGAVNVAAAGLFLGAVVLRTGSLWWGTAAHLGWNWGLGWLADLPVSGLDVADAPWVEAAPAGPAWLGGGAFGPEGSAVATVGFLAAAGACWWGRWPGPEAAARARGPLQRKDDSREPPSAPTGRRGHDREGSP